MLLQSPLSCLRALFLYMKLYGLSLSEKAFFVLRIFKSRLVLCYRCVLSEGECIREMFP